MLNYRILNFDSKSISRALLMFGKQAKSGFYYTLHKVQAKVRARRGKIQVTPRSQIDGR